MSRCLSQDKTFSKGTTIAISGSNSYNHTYQLLSERKYHAWAGVDTMCSKNGDHIHI